MKSRLGIAMGESYSLSKNPSNCKAGLATMTIERPSPARYGRNMKQLLLHRAARLSERSELG
jgi:hypothetical protein